MDKITVSRRAHNIKQVLDIKRQKIPVCGKIPHPKYNKTTLNNDIMLLQGPPHLIPPPPRDPTLLSLLPPCHHPAPSDLTLPQLAKTVKLSIGVGTIALPRAKELVKPGT
ncbi:unnamed protein product [Lepidochelys kempii]